MSRGKKIDDRLVGMSKGCLCTLTVDEMLCTGREIDLSPFNKTDNQNNFEDKDTPRSNVSKDTE